MNDQLLSIKAKKFGVRLTGFKQKKGISTETLSQWTGISKTELENFEAGNSSPSLPQIELIALKLGMMTDSLLYDTLGTVETPSLDGMFNEQYTTLRNRIIAITLRKTRTDQNRTLESVADNCMIPANDLEQLESGNLSIPWPVLESLCEVYELSVKTLIANITSSEIGSDGTTTLINQAPQIPEQLHNFINNPANLPYLELAKKLSELDAAKLRNIAEGLLEITY